MEDPRSNPGGDTKYFENFTSTYRLCLHLVSNIHFDKKVNKFLNNYNKNYAYHVAGNDDPLLYFLMLNHCTSDATYKIVKVNKFITVF